LLVERMRFLSQLDILSMHARLIAETGGSAGLRNEGALESARAAPENRYRYENADIVTCAATYAFHLTQAHAFIDGNKRIAAAITEVFLESNGVQLTLDNGQIVSLFIKIASGSLDRYDVERLVRDNTAGLSR
jgi:death-on-curing protein